MIYTTREYKSYEKKTLSQNKKTRPFFKQEVAGLLIKITHIYNHMLIYMISIASP